MMMDAQISMMSLNNNRSIPINKGAASAEEIKQTAKNFEEMYVQQMIKNMFTDLDPNGPFGGGKGEEIFQDFLIDEYGKKIASGDGIGISDAVEKHLLLLQEQSQF